MCGPLSRISPSGEIFDLGARRGDADGAELDAVGHAGRQAAVLGLAVDLAHVDAERAVPLDEVGRDRRGTGAGELHAMQADGALDVVEHQPVGDGVAELQEWPGPAPVELGIGHLEPQPDRPLVGGAADPGRLLHADGDAGIEALPDARHGEERRRRHLADVVRHRLDALGEVGDGARAQRQEGGEGALGDVAERQEGELLAVLLDRDEGVGVAELEDDVAVRQHRALGRPGRAGGVDEDRQLLGPRARDQLLPQVGIGLVVGAAELEQLVERHDHRVVEVGQALHVEDEDLDEVGAALADLEELVELLLVLDEQEAGAAVVQDVLDLLGRIGRIDAVADAAHAPWCPCRHRAIPARSRPAPTRPGRGSGRTSPGPCRPPWRARRTRATRSRARCRGPSRGRPCARRAASPDARTAWESCRSLRLRSARFRPPSRSPSSPSPAHLQVLRFFQRRLPRAPWSLMPR